MENTTKILTEEEAQMVCGKVKTLDCIMAAWCGAGEQTKISLTKAVKNTVKEIYDLFNV